MHESYADLMRGVSASLRTLRHNQPEVMAGFDKMADAALRDGELSKLTKEYIALAVGVAARCDPCIAYHVKALVRLGATRAAIEEALGVAVYMGGGPALMYAASALAAYDELAAPVAA